MKIYPSNQTLEFWSQNYFTDFDLFFVNNIPFKNKHASITSKDSFKESSSFDIKTNNLYEFWNLNDYNYVIQSTKGWFEQLECEIQEYIIKEQCRVNNPLFFKTNLITLNSWYQLSKPFKVQFFNDRIEEYQDNVVPLHLKVTLPDYLNSIVNTFPLHQGSNCLSTVLYAITEDLDILDQWIKEDSFLNTLNILGYTKSSEPSKKGDIIVYSNNKSIIHASYQVEDELFINKNGQTIFNPYKLITIADLEKNWGMYNKHVYRQQH
ncbi:hypothetical protein [Mammaliicoccus fleurettii]|uniref:hypothetical protein n=1 Tax=Mammaliicoccus fleurettii TaxID=150056 RepID=UPI001C4F511D|nr:hypothetical protein [Mammaliicoccus fleurettii]MBW0765502.1 hypothetical protein [Mammaliicoccus fleurettii]